MAKWNASVGLQLSIDYDDIEADTREEAEQIAKDRALEDIGAIPEAFYVSKRAKETVKCAVVYYANNLKHYVPLEDLEVMP